MRIILLLLGTVAAFLFLVKSVSGKKFIQMTESLDSDDFPLNSLYGVGFSWSRSKLFALKGKLRETLISQAKLLYDVRYAEYYANVVWAEFLTFVHLGITLGLVLGGAFNSGLMLFVGFVVAVLFGFYAINHMNDKLKTREQECTAELPEIVSTLALLINAGMMLKNAWTTIAGSKQGTVYELMIQACDDMNNGMSEVDAIHKFGRLTNSPEIRKFTSALCQSIERGGSELTDFLSRQSTEIWNLKKHLLLQKGEAAATKLLVPTAILFLAIIVAVISGAVGMLI